MTLPEMIFECAFINTTVVDMLNDNNNLWTGGWDFNDLKGQYYHRIDEKNNKIAFILWHYYHQSPPKNLLHVQHILIIVYCCLSCLFHSFTHRTHTVLLCLTRRLVFSYVFILETCLPKPNTVFIEYFHIVFVQQTVNTISLAREDYP